VPSTEEDVPTRSPGRLRALAAWLGLCAISACQSPAPPPAARAPAPAPRVTPAPAHVPVPAPAPAPYTRPARTAKEYKRQMGLRLVAANPGITYMKRAPDVLMGIPILEVEVNADGSVRHISVVRTPEEARETVKVAIDAVKRAAPFGDASQVPRPWKFLQVFLFDYDGHFKPKDLD
jgi:hypothetical protein